MTVREEARKFGCSISEVRRRRAKPQAEAQATELVRRMTIQTAEAELAAIKLRGNYHHEHSYDRLLAEAICKKLHIQFSVLEPD